MRIHIILHFNHISIDLHLLNIMIIARLVLLIAYGIPGAGPLSLIKPIYISQQLHSGPRRLLQPSAADYQGIARMSYLDGAIVS